MLLLALTLINRSWDSQSFLFRIGVSHPVCEGDSPSSCHHQIPVLCERVLKHPPGTGYVHQVNW